MHLALLALLSLPFAHAQDSNLKQRAVQIVADSEDNPSITYSPIKPKVIDDLELPELTTQAHIYTATFKPQDNEKWVDDCLNLSLDTEQLGCKIIAYRIQWFHGAWSSWFVPGVNDLYKKPGETLRRFWACFNDHSFEIIYQTPGKPIDFINKKAKMAP